MEIDPSAASDAQNVDLENQVLTKRKGRVLLAAPSPTVGVATIGAYRWYPPSGGTAKYLVAGNNNIYEDNGAGLLTSVVSGLTAGALAADFVGYRDKVYFADGKNTVRVRSGAGAWSAVTNIAAPGAAPVVAPHNTIAEGFDSATPAAAWTTVGSALTLTADAVIPKSGANALKLQATAGGARGSYIHKVWSFGATVDLSAADSIVLYYYAEKVGITFQVAVKDNSGTIDFSLFPVFTTLQKETWVPIRVPLAAISPASRSASTGLAIKWVDKPSKAAYPVAVYFDEAHIQSSLASDDYKYYYTYRQKDTVGGFLIRESNPSAEAKLTIRDLPPSAGVDVTVVASGDGTVNEIGIYRERAFGPFRKPRLVAVVANANGTSTDTIADGTLTSTDAQELVRGQLDPPIAATYVLANARMIAGNITQGGVNYPSRLSISRLGLVEQFGTDEMTSRLVSDPTVPGQLDIPDPDPIVRVIDFEGMVLIFCSRSIWSLEGTGWDDFVLRKRAAVGLDARWGVVTLERYVFFLAHDGFRVLVPSANAPGLWIGWVISEPIAADIRAIQPTLRLNAAVGLDERFRVHLSTTAPGGSVNANGWVFDPRQPGALEPGYHRERPGWTYYSNWGFGGFLTLKRGQGDAGQLVGWDQASIKLHSLQRSSADAALETDDGGAIAWFWQSAALDAGAGAKLELVFAAVQADPSAQTATVAPVYDKVADAGVNQDLTSGLPYPARYPAKATRPRTLSLKVAGSSTVLTNIRGVTLGTLRRQ